MAGLNESFKLAYRAEQKRGDAQGGFQRSGLKPLLWGGAAQFWRRGGLDHIAWGRASNLLCYFTDEATGFKHRLSVFSRQSYKPYEGEVAFDEEAPGGRFELATERSKRSDLPKFLAARKL